MWQSWQDVGFAGGGGGLKRLALLRRGDGVVEVFQQHGESGVLHLKFGAGEIASGLGRAAVVFRSGDFLGESEELEGCLDLAGEVGDFGGEHHAVATR